MILPLLLSILVPSAHGFAARGFTFNKPVAPADPADLVIENVWQLDETDLPGMMTHIQWVPGSQQVITSHKIGLMRLYESINADVDDYVEVLDIRRIVNSDSDHGLLSFHFHPNFALGENYLYVMYTGNPQDVTLLPNNEIVGPRRPVEWGTIEDGGYQWPLDLCPNLGIDNLAGLICEKKYYIDRMIVDFGTEVPTLTKDITLFDGVCGSSTTHGPGALIEINGDLVFSMGDGSQYEVFDAGFENLDACYEPLLGLDQGVFRAQRDEFPNGKIMRLTNEMLLSETTLTIDDVEIFSKGSRQPFRMHYQESKDRLYIGDVGYGDGGTTERIFVAEDASMVNPLGALNWGWPCIEGIYSNVDQALLGLLNPYDTPSEQERNAYLTENGLNTCDGVYNAVEAFVNEEEFPPQADQLWKAPLYEYRVGELDPDYPDYCTLDVNAALTSVFVYDGTKLPEEYTGKLIFSDHIKKCLWYFDNDVNGDPDTTTSPHVIIANAGFIDMQVGPDGVLYAIDYLNTRVVRMFTYGQGPDSLEMTPPPTTAPTAAPFAEPDDVEEAGFCYGSNKIPEFEWFRQEDGSFIGDLTFGAVTYTTEAGETRTRAYNQMIPGPIIRMKACNTYHLNLFNDLADWPTGASGAEALNGILDPTITNLHLHGLHVSGEAPGDDVTTIIQPGDVYQYTYIIPCDHNGGTYWYHPHHHGSNALQTDAGSAGMLIIEDNAREASQTPLEIQSLPEHTLIIQEFNPTATTQMQQLSGDRLYQTDVLDKYVLVNGCENAVMTIEEGQWSRIRILNVGNEFNSIIEIKPTLAADAICEVGLMAKDGVYLSTVPRILEDNKMLVSLSSRLDIAIKCPVAGVEHIVTYGHILDPAAPETPPTILTITVKESERLAAGDLPVWEPCRPVYLTDIMETPEDEFVEPFNLEVRGALNNELFTGKDNFLSENEINKAQEWLLTVTDIHPLHVHVNHLQIAPTIDATNQFVEMPNWHQAGDWVDTITGPGVFPALMKPLKYVGKMVLHCHIAQHSDTGVMAIINITGEGDEGDGSPEVEDYGTCPEVIPKSEPYMEVASVIPGTIEAENFDIGGEGVAYHNVNIASNELAVMRETEAVEIQGNLEDTWIAYIRNGEWLRYTVQVTQVGMYTLDFYAAARYKPDMKFSLWLDVEEGCPAPGSEGNLVTVDDDTYMGTGDFFEFEPYMVEEYITLPVGMHTLTFCFEGVNGYYNFDKFSIMPCADC